MYHDKSTLKQQIKSLCEDIQLFGRILDNYEKDIGKLSIVSRRLVEEYVDKFTTLSYDDKYFVDSLALITKIRTEIKDKVDIYNTLKFKHEEMQLKCAQLKAEYKKKKRQSVSVVLDFNEPIITKKRKING